MWNLNPGASYCKSIAMTNNQILQADMLDILFEHRNKLYGAYALRKSYNQRLSVSLFITLAVISAILFSFFLKKQNNHHSIVRDGKDSVVLRTIDIPDDPPPPPTPPEHRPQIASSDYRPIVVVPDPLADPQITEVAALDSTEVSNENRPGIIPNDIVRPVEITNSQTPVENSNTNRTIIYEPEEKQPSFPGGTEAWLSFLRRFLQSPEDLEPGKRVDVLVRFWVDLDGSISKPEIVKSGGYSFDKEVLRVMKKMPRWQPAVQNGRHVAVSFTQPVSFLGVED